MTRSEETKIRLEAEGWEFSRYALVRGYRPAGSVSAMADRQDCEWCRIHVGKSAGKNKEYQETIVMRREK